MNELGIDINEIIKSAYSTVLETQQAATETVGIKCIWARATPVINSEDVILQEYTLTEVGLECPQTIRAIVSNTDYNLLSNNCSDSTRRILEQFYNTSANIL